METIDQLLDAVKTKHGIKSDYKLAAFTGKTTHTIANYRHGRSRPDDETLSSLATLADIPEREIQVFAARFQAMRATNDGSRRLWEGIARRLQVGFASNMLMILLAIFSIAVFALPAWSSAVLALSKLDINIPALYIMLIKRCKLCMKRMTNTPVFS